jgi:hypothetical protein
LKKIILNPLLSFDLDLDLVNFSISIKQSLDFVEFKIGLSTVKVNGLHLLHMPHLTCQRFICGVMLCTNGFEMMANPMDELFKHLLSHFN